MKANHILGIQIRTSFLRERVERVFGRALLVNKL